MDILQDTFRQLLIRATVKEAAETEIEELVNNPKFIESCEMEEAAGPIGKDGKPRMLLLSAWIVHVGRNLNGQAFIKEELENRVREGLFAPPHAGMIDYDHDFTPRGFWYTTDFAYDTQAGEWGILANGAVWAWRFSELADSILAEMQRNGYIPVSMAALPESVEYTTSYPGFEGKATEVLHNPVFFTTSLLDISPADPAARAEASEEFMPNVANQVTDLAIANQSGSSEIQSQEDIIMDEKELEVLRQERDDALDKASKIEQEFTDYKKEIEEAQAESDKTIQELRTVVAEYEVALKSLSEAKEALEAELETVKQELAALQAAMEDIEKDNRLKARLAELPEIVVENLDAHPEKDALIKKFRDASDEEWEIIKNSFDLASTGPNYSGRSAAQGVLPRGQGADDDRFGLRKYIK